MGVVEAVAAGPSSQGPTTDLRWFLGSFLVGLLILGFGYFIYDEVSDPGPDEGDICSEIGQIVYDEDGNRLVCR